VKIKPRYFGYVDQTGHWREIGHEPTAAEASQYREVEVFYSGYAVERALTHYRAFFDEIGKHVTQLPDWIQKFYFDMKRRIEHEYQTRNRAPVPKGPTLVGEREN